MNKHIAVIMGGWSAEREVSLSSGKGMASALRSRGYDVTEIDAGRDLATELGQLSPKPDVVLNALHGTGGEDGCIQGLLEVLHLPYSHSGVTASAVAMDKPMSKRLFAAAGLPIAKHVLATKESLVDGAIPIPYVIKPHADGSSVAVFVIRSEQDEQDFLAKDWPFEGPAMVEEYIAGMELTVAVMGNRALTPIEISSGEHDFYDYESKYAPGGSQHILPPRLSSTLIDQLKDMALTAHHCLGCRGVSRSDFRYDPQTGRMAILELNTQPGMTPTSLVPDAAAHDGLSYADVVEWMVEDASCAR